MNVPFEQNITFLYTQDLTETARFCENSLGLPLVRDQGTCRIYRISRDGFIGFCQHLAAPKSQTGIIITLVTDDVDGWYERLLERGVLCEKPPTYNPQYAIYHCFFRDPNGYLFEIQRFVQPL